MKRTISLLIIAILFIVTASSCSKDTYPRDPYRGSTANPYFYNQKRLKPKQEKKFRSLDSNPMRRTTPPKNRH